MTRHIAFYAPLKSPHHATPSGDRTIARGLMNALGSVGNVELVSEFRSRDGAGDAQVQADLMAQAETEAARLITSGARWDAWVTYHNYYKAPDLIGPKVCSALGIPYHLIESSRSPKRLTGPWSRFAQLADGASDRAAVIFYFTGRDLPELENARPADQKLVHLPPFLDRVDLPPLGVRNDGKTLLAVGMFRTGDKLASYQNLASALTLVQTAGWSLRIVGAGVADAEIRALFAPFKSQVTFVGGLDANGVATEMAGADVFVWPGVNEAFGMVFIEAQAAGLTVVAENRIGLRDVVGPQGFLTPPNDAASFATAIDNAIARGSVAKDVRSYAQNHLRGAAEQTLENALQFNEASL
ncbi:glycosyltransferase family 4 protein [Roseobacter sp. N2S]|uniref:glycosyltransferase family 4 protein n=1 Tax=Roseobacter sp. N2S TaxID=2663844 RepID=UPI0028669329|nr:glycosyltransferase family 4 protein [Roseobacter sp. N2S]MDR6263146.1 glycosyltransferase involved in cell wall biosynthesis [Roseobacter sp. N2S]